jgi:hypothetical protein
MVASIIGMADPFSCRYAALSSAWRDRREVYGCGVATDSGDIAIYRGKSDMRWRVACGAVPPLCLDGRKKRR